MTMNSTEHQIAQLLRDGHSPDQLQMMIDLPAEQVMTHYENYLKQRKMQQLKASNQHHQAAYAMSLRP
ncbi:hypothetical protein Q4488_06685 [Amphritea sp. 1_MG-2023]|uniref:hypothetical protein n=1 Tax=Amphritea sp. 1_MG-2023 TaxID=3062670 RepID=UPI0026E209E5|nr:hypothetical protein [Amphritea sp. 1_MG-2023]MDO6563070.1 hypothetical protein [Amphritea sp. 1_MG-2023]